MDILIGIGVVIGIGIVFYVAWKIAVRSSLKAQQSVLHAPASGPSATTRPEPVHPETSEDVEADRGDTGEVIDDKAEKSMRDTK